MFSASDPRASQMAGDRGRGEPFGLVELGGQIDKSLGQQALHLDEEPFAFGAGGLQARAFLGGLVGVRVDQRHRGVPGEAAQQVGVRPGEHPLLVPAEDHTGTDDAAPPFDRHPDDAAQRRPVGLADMAAHDVLVPVEPHRPAAAHHLTGHAFRQRKHASGLALDADVGFFAIRAGRFVDARYGSGVAAEQIGAAVQNALQQRPQQQFAGQVLGGRVQRLGPCRDRHVATSPSSIVIPDRRGVNRNGAGHRNSDEEHGLLVRAPGPRSICPQWSASRRFSSGQRFRGHGHPFG